MKCILCDTSEVYNVLHCDCEGNFTQIYILHILMTAYTWLGYMTNTARSSIYYTRSCIIKWMRITCVFIWYCTHTTTYTIKIPPHPRPIFLPPHTNLYTKILPHTLIHKIPLDAHHTLLQYYILVQSYIRHTLRAIPSLAQEKMHHIIHKKIPRLHHNFWYHVRLETRFYCCAQWLGGIP